MGLIYNKNYLNLWKKIIQKQYKKGGELIH